MLETLFAKTRPWILVAPFGVGIVVLAGELVPGELETLNEFLSIALIPLTIVGSLGAWFVTKRTASRRVAPLLAAAIAPCALAPLGVAAAWAVVPGHLGMSYGGFSFFLHWLTKYPNLGPVNYEVLLGMLCLLGGSAIPAALAFYRLQTRVQTSWTLAAFLVLQLVAYIPLFIRLDFYQLFYAVVVCLAGPMTAMGGVPMSVAERLGIASEGAGAFIRLAATIGMLVAFLHSVIANRHLAGAAKPVASVSGS